MGSRMRVGIRAQLLAGFGITLLPTVLLGATAAYGIYSVNLLGSQLYEQYLVPVRDLAQARADVGTIDSEIQRAITDQGSQNRLAYSAAAEKDAAEIDHVVALSEGASAADQEQQALAKLRVDWGAYKSAFREVLTAAGTGDVAGATRLYFDHSVGPYASVDGDLAQLIEINSRLAGEVNQAMAATYQRVLMLTGLIPLATVGVGLLLALLLSRRIANAAAHVAAAARGLARGDLNQTIAVHSADELGQMAQAFRDMVAHLRGVTGEIQQGAHHLSDASGQILAAVAQQSAGTSEQAAAIAETTATVDQVKASAEQAVQLALVVAETAQEALRVAGDGVQAAHFATDGMADLHTKVQAIADNILALADQSQQIGEIIATVTDLADQSNLLALNAAIEASRAGEHGRGFAVVAAEIRTLAEQSKAHTAQVRTLLSDIQRATNAAVLATEQGTRGVETGTRLVEQTGATIDQLTAVIEQAAGSAQQIAASVRQHAVGMDQIVGAMSDINGASAQSAAATASTRQAAENLTQLASHLNQLLAQYQLSESAA